MRRWQALTCVAILAITAGTSHAQCSSGMGRGRPGSPGFGSRGPGGPGNIQMMLFQQQQMLQQTQQQLVARQRQQLMLQEQRKQQQQLIARKRREQEVQRLTQTARELTDPQLETALTATQQRLEQTAKLTPSESQRNTLVKYMTMRQILAAEASRRWDSEKVQLVLGGQAPEEEQGLREQPLINVNLGLQE